jgi:hypothetical protein
MHSTFWIPLHLPSWITFSPQSCSVFSSISCRQTKESPHPLPQSAPNTSHFARDTLRDLPESTLLVMKHVLVRSPDRVVMRENAAIVVDSLSKLLPDPSPIICFFSVKLFVVCEGGTANPRD